MYLEPDAYFDINPSHPIAMQAYVKTDLEDEETGYNISTLIQNLYAIPCV